MFCTVKTGERVAVWAANGSVRFVDGHKIVFAPFGKIERLKLWSAGPESFLVIQKRDGSREHVPGPAAVWFDPVEHAAIEELEALTLDGNEAIVVYKKLDDGAIERRVERGPCVFVGEPTEWLHQFRWHGSDPKDPTRKIPAALRFQKLRVIPDQMYCDIDKVRTSDDALLTIKLMIFFELVDIEQLLDTTHDPIADFLNGATADIMDFVGARRFEKFKSDAEALNDLETYPQLLKRAERMGYRIGKVAYRGFDASASLQAMHDEAIETRTKLRLEAEAEEQAQDLADLKLQREHTRSAETRAETRRTVEHEGEMLRLENESRLARERVEAEQEHELRRALHEIELEHEAATNHERLAFLERARALEVDLTRYLVAQYQNPDRLIRVEGGADLHVHE